MGYHCIFRCKLTPCADRPGSSLHLGMFIPLEKGGFGTIVFMESIEVRDKLFSTGTCEALAKYKPLGEELKKYTTSKYKVTDWVIQ